MQHAVNKRLEKTVLKPAVKSVVDQTKLATTSMDPAFLVVLLDIKETDAKIVSEVLKKKLLYSFTSLCQF